MWEDPILKELYRVRAKMAKETPGLKKLNQRGKQIVEELRTQGIQIVTLHKVARMHKNSTAPQHSRMPGKAAG